MKSLLLLPFLAINLFAGEVWLAWDPSETSEVTGYRVYIGTASRNYSGFKDAGNALEYKAKDLPNGIVHYFAATAYDADGNESDYSNEASTKVITCDLNNDSSVNVLDLQLMINLIQTNQLTQAHDLNKDSVLNILDFQTLINVLSGKQSCR